MAACRNGCTDVVECLLACEPSTHRGMSIVASLVYQAKDGVSALFNAIDSGVVDVVRLLLEFAARFLPTSEGPEGYSESVLGRYKDVLRTILSTRLPNFADPLIASVSAEHIDVARVLLE